MVKGWQVTPPHQDQVTAGLTRAAGRQQPQFPGACTAEERSRTWPASSDSGAELYVDGPLLGATENDQFDHTVGRRLERLEQIIHATDGLASRSDDQVARCETGTRGWTVVLHKANQQTLSIRQTDGTPQTSGDMRRRYSDTKPNAALRLTLSQAVHSRSRVSSAGIAR